MSYVNVNDTAHTKKEDKRETLYSFFFLFYSLLFEYKTLAISIAILHIKDIKCFIEENEKYIFQCLLYFLLYDDHILYAMFMLNKLCKLNC